LLEGGEGLVDAGDGELVGGYVEVADCVVDELGVVRWVRREREGEVMGEGECYGCGIFVEEHFCGILSN